MNKTFTLCLVLLSTALASCHRYYTSSQFDVKTARHKHIAVLPPKMILTGKQPTNLSQKDLLALEEKESLAFQEALFNNILKKGNRGRYQLAVNVQPLSNTVAALRQNNISIRDSWALDDKTLCEMLKVDAVVRTTIQKDRIMSDLASAGVYVGTKIINVVLNRPPVMNGNVHKSGEITATCTLVANGETLWNDRYQRDSDFTRPANEVIENITNRFASHFPYRSKA